MALNSINTNIAAIRAQENIGMANRASSSSIARLSSGERITRAADDVAALSAGTSLRTNVTTLRTALINTSQGASLLQVADGALAQITDILQRQKAIAVQAGAGSLTSAERGFLNQEFQNLTAEIDRLAGQTNFNGVTLLDGSLFDITTLDQNTTEATAARGQITFTGNVAEGKTVIIQGVTLEFDTNGAPTGDNTAVAIATANTIDQNIAALADFLNNSTDVRFSGAEYSATNTTLTIVSRSGGTANEQYSIQSNGTASYNVTAGATNVTTNFVLEGGNNLGIAAGDVFGTGTIGDSIVAAQNQTAAFTVINFSNSTVASFADGLEIDFSDGVAGAAGDVTFEFDTAGDGLGDASHVAINTANATTKTEFIDAAVEAINRYIGVRNDGTVTNDDYVLKQIEARREGETIVLENRDFGNITQIATNFTALAQNVNTDVTSASFTGSQTFANGSTSGITTSGIRNSEFIGTIQGFNATFNGTSNVVDLSVEVGGRTYSASAVNVTTNQNVRLVSVEGDFFDIGLQGAAQALTVTQQSDADLIASRLDTALSTLTFYQDREISSYTAAGDIISEGEPIGSLTGSSFSLQSSNFAGAQIDDVRVNAPLEGTTNGTIEVDINGVTYRSRGDIGNEIGSNAVIELTSLENANDVLTFRTGTINLLQTDGTTVVNSIEFETDNKAAAFEQALEDAFGIGEGGQTLQFQVGVTTSDTLDISIGTVTTENIYGGEALDVLTEETASRASDVLDAAIDAVTSVRAEVGALQSRFDFAAANVESSIQNQEAARGVLLDTDVASESTAFATAQVQLQAGISVLAQANLLPQNLLKLIG